MKARFALPLAVVACVSAQASHAPANLEQVIAHPLKHSGQVFQGDAFIFLGDGFYAFFPQPVTSGEQIDPTTPIVIAGGNVQSLRDSHKDSCCMQIDRGGQHRLDAGHRQKAEKGFRGRVRFCVIAIPAERAWLISELILACLLLLVAPMLMAEKAQAEARRASQP